MRSGSPAHDDDGRGWPATQRPYQDEAIGGPAHYGSGPRSDPHQAPAGRRDIPYGPELSWPSGFRPLDAQTRDVLEAGYGTGPYRTTQADPRYRAGRDNGPGYQQPAMEDYGYGDPGYSDPSYDGPRSRDGGSAGRPPRGYPATDTRMPGYHVPEDPQPRPAYQQDHAAPSAGDQRAYPGPGGHDAYPGTGSTGSYPGTGGNGAHPGTGSNGSYPGTGGNGSYPGTGSGSYPGTGGYGAFPGTGSGEAYPGDGGGQDIYPTTGAMEALTSTDPFGPSGAPGPTGAFGSTGTFDAFTSAGPATPAPAAPSAGRPADRRLEGLRYDELRYDEPAYDEGGFDQSPDDVSWYEDLRRSAPVYPDRPGGGPNADDRRPGDRSGAAEPQRGTGPQRRPDQTSGYQQAPGRDDVLGHLQPRSDRGGSRPQLSTTPVASGQYPGSPGPGPRLSTGSGPRPAAPTMSGAGPRLGAPAEVAPASWAGGPSEPKTGRQPVSAFSSGPELDATVFLSAPTTQVGVLTPPDGTRIDLPALDSLSSGAAQTATAWVRPGHGLDGPEITSSWPAQPQAEDFSDFWQDDENEDEYSGLFADDDDIAGRRRASARSARRAIGRRRGGSNDHRLWIALGGVVIAAAAAITGIIKFEFPAHTGPVHAMEVANQIGTYTRTVDLEKETHLGALRNEVIKMADGQASGVVDAVYESGDSAAGGTTQIIMFIGGHLANADPAASIATFRHDYPGAFVVSAGPLGGEAACVESKSGTSNSVGMCAWFDDDSFGELTSPTMTATQLGHEMLDIRAAVEHVVRN